MVNLNGGLASKQWVKSWVRPPKKQASNGAATFQIPSGISSGDATNSNTTPQPPATPLYEFEVHSWVLVDEVPNQELQLDQDSKDFLDLSQYYYDSHGTDTNQTANKTSAGGLTDADIRGAVGGGDVISFAGSTAKDTKEDIKSESDNATPELETDAGSEDTKDTDGDIKIE